MDLCTSLAPVLREMDYILKSIMEQKETKSADLKQVAKMALAASDKTMAHLASEIGKSGGTLSEILSRGKPNLGTVINILKALNCELIVRFESGQEVELVIK